MERPCLQHSNQSPKPSPCFPSGTMLCNLGFSNTLRPIQAAGTESLKAAGSKSAGEEWSPGPHQDAAVTVCVHSLGFEKSSAHKTTLTSRQGWVFHCQHQQGPSHQRPCLPGPYRQESAHLIWLMMEKKRALQIQKPSHHANVTETVNPICSLAPKLCVCN